VFWYGATSTVNMNVPFPTTSAAAVKSKLDQKQYTNAQVNPSTLVSALNTVDSQCATSCRIGVPRVTIVISSTPDLSAEATIRQLERDLGMTVIVAGIGSTATTSVLNRLASHPTGYYAVPIASFYELILSAQHIGSIISDVPRLLDINSNPLHISTTSSSIYYTVQLNTYSYTTTNDTIILVATNCPGCSIYGSLNEPNPTSINTIANTQRSSFFAYSGYPNSLFYFRLPQGARRLYLSVLGNGMSGMYILANTFTIPNMMQTLSRNIQEPNIYQTIG